LWISEHIKNICGEITILEQQSAPTKENYSFDARIRDCSPDEEKGGVKSGAQEKEHVGASGNVQDGSLGWR